MADKESDNHLLPGKPPRRKYLVWVSLATVVVLIGLMWINNASDLKEINNAQFEQMVRSGDVRRVTLIKNLELVEITLKSEALQNAKYRQGMQEGPLGVLNTAGPHYKYRIISVDHFGQNYDELAKNLSSENIPEFNIEMREDYIGVFIQWGFLFLIIFGMVMLIQWLLRLIRT
jgi:AFG3 family protein